MDLGETVGKFLIFCNVLQQIALMDRRECIVISDATSVQPICRSRVDLSIIRLVAKAVEAEMAVGGVEEDLRNL